MRWFAFDGPDTLDNGLALCVQNHKLFDLGVLGLDAKLRVQVSATFGARTPSRPRCMTCTARGRRRDPASSMR